MRTAMLSLALLVAGPALADEKGADSAEVRAALELPAKAQVLRAEGVEDAEVKKALDGAKERKVKASEAGEALDGAADAVREHGPVDNFGAFVQEQLESREVLVIRAEPGSMSGGRSRPRPTTRFSASKMS